MNNKGESIINMVVNTTLLDEEALKIKDGGSFRNLKTKDKKA